MQHWRSLLQRHQRNLWLFKKVQSSCKTIRNPTREPIQLLCPNQHFSRVACGQLRRWALRPPARGKKLAKIEQRHRFQIFVRPAELKARRCAASRHQFSTTSEKLQQNEHFPVENYDWGHKPWAWQSREVGQSFWNGRRDKAIRWRGHNCWVSITHGFYANFIGLNSWKNILICSIRPSVTFYSSWTLTKMISKQRFLIDLV